MADQRQTGTPLIRGFQRRYIITYAIAIPFILLAGIGYELWARDDQLHILMTLSGVPRWIGASLAIPTIALIYWELLDMVLRRIYREEGRKQGEEEANNRWLEWNKRREEARDAGRDFTEPPPAKPANNS